MDFAVILGLILGVPALGLMVVWFVPDDHARDWE